MVDKIKKETHKILEALEAGKAEGENLEAVASLKRRFTEREINALILIVWFSEPMQSIRNRIGELERATKAKEEVN